MNARIRLALITRLSQHPLLGEDYAAQSNLAHGRADFSLGYKG